MKSRTKLFTCLELERDKKHKIDLTSSKIDDISTSADLCQKIFTLVVCWGRIQKIICIIYYIFALVVCGRADSEELSRVHYH